jgi:hypothetical protein
VLVVWIGAGLWTYELWRQTELTYLARPLGLKRAALGSVVILRKSLVLAPPRIRRTAQT